jgi:putative serine protease PepD
LCPHATRDESVADYSFKGSETMSALVLLAGFAVHAGDEVRLNEPAGYLGIAPAVDRDKPTVESVAENSPAAKAGLKVGDVITKLDGKDMGTLAEFTSAMQKRKAGDEVTLTLLRGTDTIEVKAKLIARPKPK